MSRFVRPSKYRHVYGSPAKPEASYLGVKASQNAWDTNLLAANKQYLSLNWQAGGGGAFAIIPTSRVGKLPDVYPLCRGHTATVLDTAFSPFDDSVVVSGADDGNLGIWKVEDSIFDVLDMSAKELESHGGVKDMQPRAKIDASGRKVGQVMFHPTASNVVAAAGGDHVIKLFDIESQKEHSALSGFTDSIQSIDFDWTGSTLAASCRDRKLRIFDPRAGGQAVQVADSHPGIKGSRVIWCGSTNRLATTGFSKTSDRQLWVWDSGNIKTPIKQTLIDTSSGVMMPFWSDNSIIFLAGKGDGNVRYYELDSDELHYLSEYKSTDPQRGMAFLPRRDLNADENEIARAYKLTNNMIQPISFICPRRADSFQADIFPPAPSSKPALTSQEFFAGKTALPNLISLQDGSGVSSKAALPAASATASAPAPSPAVAPASTTSSAPSATPTATRATPASSAPAPVAAAAAGPAPTPAPTKATDPLPEPTRAAKVSQPTSTTSAPSASADSSKNTLAALRENGAESAPKTTAPAGVTSGIGDLASELQRLLADSAARDARLRELEIENEKLKTEHHRLREDQNGGNGTAAPSGGDQNFSADRFFETQSAPSNLSDFGDKARQFVDRHAKEGRKVVLVTSGGTTVPLEQNVVRFLDNFSAGTRGATSAEYFLAKGYAVIFMHRQHSLSPFTRHYSHTTNPFLDLLEHTSQGSTGSGIGVRAEAAGHLEPVLRDYLHHSRSEAQGGAGTLLSLPFVTVNDYLFLLREMSKVMQPLGRRGMYYLAAAVSDFFVPNQRTPQHKIQSGKGSLVIEMDQVPKVLKPMVQQWAPEGFVVSFKLETDMDLLLPKASAALRRYGHQIVIANDLNTRKEKVCFVTNGGVSQAVGGTAGGGEGDGIEGKWLELDRTRDGPDAEIEEKIVDELAVLHERWIEQGASEKR